MKAAENPDRITQSRWIKNSCLNYSRLDRTCALRLGAGDSLTEGFRLLTAGLASDLLVTAGLACAKFLRLLLLSLITIVCDLIGGRRDTEDDALLTTLLLAWNCSSSNSSSSTSSSGSGLEAELEVALDELRL